MVFWDFTFALAMALVVSLLFGLIFRRTWTRPRMIADHARG
jgi:hypothetical protein